MRTFLLLSLCAVGCKATDPNALVCDGTGQVVVFADGATPIGSDGVTLTGTAEHTGGLTIRSLLVGGVPAVNGGGNYRTWSATLPLAQLRALDTDGDGTVEIGVTGRDTCDQTFEDPAAAVLVLDPEPEVDVTTIGVVPTVPAGTGWLPADGVTPAILAITGNPQAAGATVTLTTSVGTLSASTLTLAGDGTADATGTVLFTSAVAGTAVFIAEADGVAGTGTLIVAGPPALSPDAATLLPGETLTVDIWTDGAVESCAAYGSSSGALGVTSGGLDLYGGGTVSDIDADGRPELVVAASVDAAAASVEVTCCDLFQQCATGSYSVP